MVLRQLVGDRLVSFIILNKGLYYIILFAGDPGISLEQNCVVVKGTGKVTCPGMKCAFSCITSCGRFNDTNINSCQSQCEEDNVKALCCE